MSQAPDGSIQWDRAGDVKIPAEGSFNWIWIETADGFTNAAGRAISGLCTDSAPLGDLGTPGSPAFEVACPFLKPNEGTPEAPIRPCAIQIRPQFSNQWGLVCGWRKDQADMSQAEIDKWNPPERMTAAGVAQWTADHTHCTFTWDPV